MKQFILRTSRMLLLIGALLTAFHFFNKALFSYSSLFKMEKECSTLILGDSHTKYAFDDRIIRNTHNFSKDADSYFYSFLKLREIHRRNVQLDTLILSFSGHNLNKIIEREWLMNSGQLQKRLPLYFPLMDTDDFMFLFKHRPAKLLENLFGQFLFPLYLFTKGNSSYGGYENLKYNILQNEIQKQDYKNDDFSTISELEKKYLLKIKSYCTANDIKLMLICSPRHKLVQSRQENLYKFYDKYLSDVLFVDFTTLPMDDNCFGDFVHLTPTGSRYFSTLVEQKGIINLARSTMKP